MKKTIAISSSVAAFCLLATPVLAGPDEDQLVINGELEMITEANAPEHLEYVSWMTLTIRQCLRSIRPLMRILSWKATLAKAVLRAMKMLRTSLD